MFAKFVSFFSTSILVCNGSRTKELSLELGWMIKNALWSLGNKKYNSFNELRMASLKIFATGMDPPIFLKCGSLGHGKANQ